MGIMKLKGSIFQESAFGEFLFALKEMLGLLGIFEFPKKSF